MEGILSDLINAATIMNAPPSAVGLDQRKQAENFLLKFKKSDKPYAICKRILENSDDPYLHFLASSTLKEGIMREWAMLGNDEIDQLRDYLLNYTHQHLNFHSYVLRQMLHVVALIVKRSLLTRDPAYLQGFASNVCSLFNSPATLSLGLEIAGALLAEFTVADKTLSSYMSYQHNLDCKKAIEGDGLYQIFVSTVEVLNRLRGAPIGQHRKEWILVMNILYSVLSWDFGVILSKRLAQMSNLSLSVINLMPGSQWSILKEENVLSLLVELYRLFATDRELQHVARLCIVQLGTLQGSVFDNQDERVTFLSRYIAAIVKLLVGACESSESDEDHGLALAVRQLLWANTCQDLNNIHVTLFKEFLATLTDLSIKVFLKSTKDDEESTEDVVDVVLDIWLTLHQMMDTLPRSPLDSCMLRVVECYVNCHLAPPAGIRNDSKDLDEVDVDTEEDDRVKYRDQLDIVGNLARVNIGATLKHFNALLLERTRLLKSRVETQEECNPLFEDIHWLVMLLGYTLSDAHTDTDLTIPAPILEYLAACQETHRSDTVEVLSQYTQCRVGKCGELPPVNDVLTAILVLSELAAVYQEILGKGGRHYLSPQVYSSLMWSLTRISASYLMPNEQDYEYIPQSLLTLGEESSVARWMLAFLVEKVISGLLFYSGEQATIEDCLALIQTFAKNPRISSHLLGDPNFQKLIERYTGGILTLSSSKANKMLAASLVTAMSHLPVTEQRPFMDKVFGPIRDNTVQMFSSGGDVAKIPNSPQLTHQVLTSLDTFHGIASGIIHKTVEVVFSSVMPVLEGCVALMEVSQHVQPITSSILQLYCAVADSGILQMDKSQTNRLYETCYKLLKCYSDASPTRAAAMVGTEDDRYDNILLCLELLSHLCSKDFFVFDEPDKHDDTSSRLVLVGLDIIVPHIDVELLKFPKLSSEFFKLITFICEVYPEKVVGLPENVIDQIVLMLKVGLNNYNDDITFYIFNAVSALALHSLGNQFFQRKIGQIIKHTLLLISGQELSAELYDTAADMVFSFICKCREEYLVVVNEIVIEQPDSSSQECLRSAFSALIPNTTNISRRDKGKFSKIFENFAVNVYGICR